MPVESIPVVNAASISRSLENATESQLNSFFDNALHVGPFFLSEQTVTPHAEEKHLFGIDINYSDINQPPYVGLGVNSARVGWNLNGAGRIDPDYSGFALCWEHRYTINDNPSGVLVDEFHLLGTSRDAPPEDWRMLSFIKPQIVADAGFGTDNGYISTWGFAFYQSTLGAGDGNLRMWMEWTVGGGYMAFADGVGFQSLTPADGTPIFQQLNAAGLALIKLPYLDANETLKIDQPMIVAGSTNPVTNAFVDLTPSAATTGQKTIVVNGPTVTGTYYIEDYEATGSVAVVNRLRNTSSAANAIASQQIHSNSTTGHAKTEYWDGTTGTGAECGWHAGNARFHIAVLGGLGYAPWEVFTINPYPAGTPTTSIFGTCNLPLTNFNAPLNLKSYTVGTLPSAATDGGFIYVTDEAGGEQPAFSDGTNWRRCASGDRAIVS